MNFLRSGARIPVELPVEITWKTRAGKPHRAQGKTATMSGNGVLMAVPVHLRADTPIRIAVRLPQQVTRIPLVLLCEGRVVPQPKSISAEFMGAIIDDYRFRPAPRMV
jgi:hypothetical protein